MAAWRVSGLVKMTVIGPYSCLFTTQGSYCVWAFQPTNFSPLRTVLVHRQRTMQYPIISKPSATMLYMTKNVTIMSDENNTVPSPSEGNPLVPIVRLWDSFGTSSLYRTLLFTGALLSSKSVRDFLGVLGCFSILMGSFCLYYYDARFNYLVDVVTPKRQTALKALRAYKTKQLSTSMKEIDDDSGTTTLSSLLNAYETALREELATRVLIPPNIWVIEMDPTQEDRSAAPQLLGLRITDQYTLEKIS